MEFFLNINILNNTNLNEIIQSFNNEKQFNNRRNYLRREMEYSVLQMQLVLKLDPVL